MHPGAGLSCPAQFSTSRSVRSAQRCPRSSRLRSVIALIRSCAARSEGRVCSCGDEPCSHAARRGADLAYSRSPLLRGLGAPARRGRSARAVRWFNTCPDPECRCGRGEGRGRAQIRGATPRLERIFLGGSIAQLINEVTMAHATMALYTPAVTSSPGEGLPRTLARFASGASISLRRVAALSRLREGGSRFCNTETGCVDPKWLRVRILFYQTPIRPLSDSHQTPIRLPSDTYF